MFNKKVANKTIDVIPAESQDSGKGEAMNKQFYPESKPKC